MAQIAGLRNRIVHDYAGIDLEIIWEVVETALPEFQAKLQALDQKGLPDSETTD